MSRGSVSSWQDYGRRSSQCMPQFSGGPVEFMTCDDIQCKRADGWFLSYTKIAGIIVVFIIGVVAAGFLGWYINSLPQKKDYEALDLLNDEIENTDDLGENTASPFVHPLKYRLELTPIIVDINVSSKLIGRVFIEFQVNDTTGVNKLSLNAKNITTTNCKLTLLHLEENKKPLRKRRRRRANDAINHNGQWDDTVSENAVMVTLMENETVVHSKSSENPLESKSTVEESKVPLINYASVSGINSSRVNNVVQFGPESFENASLQMRIANYDTDEDKEVHTIYLEKQIQQGVYLLEIEYKLSISDNIFFLANYSSSDGENWLMGTRLKHCGARCLFPVFDDVTYKSVFSVSIARPKEMTVLSNMPLRTLRDALDSSLVIDTFDDSPPISPHNLAFVMGHIEAMNATLIGDTEVVATFWRDSNRPSPEIYLFDKLNSVVVNLMDLFLTSYPYPKLDLVGLPPGINENMGSPGLIAIKQSLFYASDKSPQVTKDNALKVLVTLMGQQWLDEFMNVNRTNAWIFESLLYHLKYEIIQKIDSSLDLADSFIIDVQLHVMEIDGYSISRPFHENVNYHLLPSIDYEHAKGKPIIQLVRLRS